MENGSSRVEDTRWKMEKRGYTEGEVEWEREGSEVYKERV